MFNGKINKGFEEVCRVYIASPYTKGDQALNVRLQMDVGHKLLDLGCAPFVPLLYHFMHISFPHHYNEWLDLDLIWLKQSHCLIRFPGESSGADYEVSRAIKWDIPVFFAINENIPEDFLRFLKEKFNYVI